MSKSINYNKTRGTAYLISKATGIHEETIDKSLSFFRYNLNRYKRASHNELVGSGLTAKQTEKIMAYLESITCFTGYIAEDRPTMNCPSDVYRALATDMQYLEQETFRILLLNTKNQLIEIKTITVGLLDMSLCHPREIFRAAIMANCSSIVLAHNHPSGSITPSAQDLEITRSLIEAGKIMNIEIIDHIITGGSGKFLSMKEKRLI